LRRHRLKISEERGDAGASRVSSAVEHVFAYQKGLAALVARTIGIARAKMKIGMADLTYDIRRFVWLQGQ